MLSFIWFEKQNGGSRAVPVGGVPVRIPTISDFIHQDRIVNVTWLVKHVESLSQVWDTYVSSNSLVILHAD